MGAGRGGSSHRSAEAAFGVHRCPLGRPSGGSPFDTCAAAPRCTEVATVRSDAGPSLDMGRGGAAASRRRAVGRRRLRPARAAEIERGSRGRRLPVPR